MSQEPVRDNSEKLDAELHEAFSKISLPVLTFVRPTPDSYRVERADFLAGTTENPQFEYSVEVDQLDEAARQIETTWHIWHKHNAHPAVQALYQDKLEEAEAKLGLGWAILKRDMVAFDRETRRLNGDVLSGFSAFALGQAKAKVTALQGQELAAPLASTFAAVADTQGVFEELQRMVPHHQGAPTQEVLSATEVKEAFEAALVEHGFQDEWRVVIDESGTQENLSVMREIKTIMVPQDEQLKDRREPLDQRKLRALIEHEVGVHLVRGEQARAGVLALLVDGLDRYLPGEEGLAMYVQKQHVGDGMFGGIGHYVTASIARGLDRDNRSRTFREVFEWNKAYYQTVGPVEADPSNLAWSATLRLFRGTTGSVPGVIFTRDTAYLEGSVYTYHFLAAHPEFFEHLLVGKYDPARASHVKNLRSIDVLPKGFPIPQPLNELL